MAASHRPGQRDVGRFQLLDIVGVGAFGTVYKARDPELDRIVAIKIPRAGNLGSSGDADRFLREARSVAQLRHPSIVPVYETGQSDGQPYLVSEFVEGVTLADLLTAHRPSFREVAQLIAALADALHYAHQQGVVHRDVKPTNIMLSTIVTSQSSVAKSRDGVATGTGLLTTDYGRPKLMDFGLAKRDAGEITMTMDGQILGTPAYMSPEQAKGEAHEVDGRSDVYSLGVILYEMLTGELPFRGNRRMLLLQVLQDEPRPPRHINDHIPRDLETVCLKAMAKEPARRYATAAELSADLHRYLEGKPILARPVGQAERFRRWCGRNRALATACALAITALVAVSIVSALFAFHSNHAAEREFRSAEALREEQGKTEAALDEAKTERRHAEDQLVRMYVSNGVRLMDEGDLIGSLPWFAKALEEEKGGREREEIHRIRLGVVFRQCPKLVQAWKFDHPVSYAEFSPDGSRILIAAANDTRVWDSKTGQALTRLLTEKPNSGVYVAQAFTPDGTRLATLGPDQGAVTIWDGTTGKPVTESIKDQYSAGRIMFSPDGRFLLIVSAAAGHRPGAGQARVWDASTGQPVTPPIVPGGTIQYAAFSPDGRRLVIADDGTVRVWDATTGTPITEPMVHQGRVTFTGFSPDSRRLVIAEDRRGVRGSSPQLQGEARLWEAATGRPLTPPMKHHRSVSFAVFSPDGKHLLTVCGHQMGSQGEQDVWVWDASGTALIPPLQHKALVTHASFSPDGRYVVTASADQTTRVWNVVTGEPMTPPLPHGSPVNHCVFSPDGLEVLTSSGHYTTIGGEARTWAWAAAANPVSAQTTKIFGSLFLSPDGRRAISYWTSPPSTVALRNQAIYSWNRSQVLDVSTGKAFPLEHEGHPYYAAFSPDGRYVVTATGNLLEREPPRGEARVWEVATGRPVGPAMRHDHRVFYASFSPDGNKLLTVERHLESLGGQADTFRVWNVSTGKPDIERIQEERLADAVFSPDGRLIMTVSLLSARLWDASTGQPVGSPIRLANQRGRIGSWIGRQRLTSFSPDGHLVIVALGGETAQVRNGHTGEEVSPPLKHSKRVDHVQFSPDGRRILTVTEDMVRVFDAITGIPITPPLVHGQRMSYATFSPSGRLVATTSFENGARIWDAATGEPVTPVFSHSSTLQQAQFTPDGRRLITIISGEIFTWDVAPDPRPVEDLALMSDLLSCRTFDSRGSLVPRLTGAAPVLPVDGTVPQREVLQIEPALQDLRGRYENQFTISLSDRIAWHRKEAKECEAAGLDSAAICHLDRLIEAEPSNESIHQQRAKAHQALGHLDKAVDDYSKVIGLKPNYWQAWEARGLLYAQQEDWAKAAADFSKSMNEAGAPWLRSGWNALALAGAGDKVGHHEACSRLLQKFGDTENPNMANDVAWFCVRFPEAVNDPARPLQLAEMSVAKNPKSHPYLNTLGAALYRAKRFEDSIKGFDDAIKAHGQGGHPSDWLFLAMAHYRLGHAAEAKRWMEKTQQWLDKFTQEKPKDATAAANPLPWDQRLELKLILAEAETLIKMETKQK